MSPTIIGQVFPVDQLLPHPKSLKKKKNQHTSQANVNSRIAQGLRLWHQDPGKSELMLPILPNCCMALGKFMVLASLKDFLLI